MIERFKLREDLLNELEYRSKLSNWQIKLQGQFIPAFLIDQMEKGENRPLTKLQKCKKLLQRYERQVTESARVLSEQLQINIAQDLLEEERGSILRRRSKRVKLFDEILEQK